ncbi:LexA-binding, inner membrane-associated putative hydrolase [uncultured archaeon]|nr:LexA-binding, inner membrane-associated putative hydrolase [uncultured archaeon]
MPFTPFHWGPASLTGLLFFRIFYFPALLAASVIIDIEPFSILVFDMDYPLHGFFHSFLGGALVAGLISTVMYFFRNDINKLMRMFKLEQESSFRKIIWTSFFGVYLHILLDSTLYIDMKPFYPAGSNPFYGLFSQEQVYLFSGVSFLAAIMVYIVRVFIVKRK